jgi:hypothetical protein
METTNFIGTGRRAAYALSLGWPENVCSRATLRALMPEGESGHRRDGNRITRALNKWLRDSQRRGHVQLGGLFVRVLNSKALLANAVRHLDSFEARVLINPGAIEVIEEQLAEESNPGVAERRRAELTLLLEVLRW